MKWEQSTTTSGGKTTIHLTDEAKKRLRVGEYRPPDHSRMPTFDKVVLGLFIGLPAVALVVIVGLLAWAHVFGGA